MWYWPHTGLLPSSSTPGSVPLYNQPVLIPIVSRSSYIQDSTRILIKMYFKWDELKSSTFHIASTARIHLYHRRYYSLQWTRGEIRPLFAYGWGSHFSTRVSSTCRVRLWEVCDDRWCLLYSSVWAVGLGRVGASFWCGGRRYQDAGCVASLGYPVEMCEHAKQVERVAPCFLWYPHLGISPKSKIRLIRLATF